MLMGAITLAGPLAAQQDPGPGWRQLSPPQRAALAPLEPSWTSLTPAQRAKWQQVADRMPAMGQDERQRVRDRMAEWVAMSPDDRRRARLQFTDSRGQMSAEERQARWQAYQQLDASAREALQPVPPRPSPKAVLAATAVERAASASGRSAPASTTATTAAARTPQPLSKGQREHLPAVKPTALPVAPSVVQARPGATTTLMSKAPQPLPPVQAGMPRINATPGFVDSRTLLPLRGAQAAAVVRRGPALPDEPGTGLP
jgi:hypothetical protein